MNNKVVTGCATLCHTGLFPAELQEWRVTVVLKALGAAPLSNGHHSEGCYISFGHSRGVL